VIEVIKATAVILDHPREEVEVEAGIIPETINYQANNVNPILSAMHSVIHVRRIIACGTVIMGNVNIMSMTI
jgi:hypothetical protein